MGICSSNCPTHKGGVYLFSHMQNRNQKNKIKNPKNNIEKAKRRGKRKPTRRNRDK